MITHNNWYFFYNTSGYKNKDIKELSSELEKLGYKYNQCTELGAGPSIEQVIAWINNNQLISTFSISLAANLFSELLKALFKWFKIHKIKKKNIIPVVEFFMEFKDFKKNGPIGRIRFRIDREYNKKEISKIIKQQLNYLYTSTRKKTKCIICSKPIYENQGFFLERKTKLGPICNFCLEEKLSKGKRDNK